MEVHGLLTEVCFSVYVIWIYVIGIMVMNALFSHIWYHEIEGVLLMGRHLVSEYVGCLLQVWRFLITFADVLKLWPFTLDEFVQAFHDYVSHS